MRILVHYTHKQTLGHTTRTISLVKALCDRGAEVRVLQGGMPQPFVRFPENCIVRDIPRPFDTRGSFQADKEPVYAYQRAQFILRTAIDFKPHVMITEFFPFGRHKYLPELLPALQHLRKKKTRIMASIGYPLIMELESLNKSPLTLMKAMFHLFSKFLIHTPPELETQYIKDSFQSGILSQSYAEIMERLKKKIVYTGYIFPEKIIAGGAELPVNKKTNDIVISRGGGSVYPKLIAAAIKAQRHLDKNISTIIACGPATSVKEKNLFHSLLDPNDTGRVFLADHINNLHDYLKTCAVSVNLCGYNTSVQLMRYGTPSIIIPYHNVLSRIQTNDQIARARLMRERFSSTILDCRTLTGPSLARAIKEKINQPRPRPAPAEWFNGAATAAQAILENKAN